VVGERVVEGGMICDTGEGVRLEREEGKAPIIPLKNFSRASNFRVQ
jgi:hypothetical protein